MPKDNTIAGICLNAKRNMTLTLRKGSAVYVADGCISLSNRVADPDQTLRKKPDPESTLRKQPDPDLTLSSKDLWILSETARSVPHEK